MRKELENRLVNLAVKIEGISKKLKKGFYNEHLSTQIIRSSTSAALNYGEAQAAESKSDFIHKISIVLKELRETQVNLKMLKAAADQNLISHLDGCHKECNELVAIFHKTVMTAKSRK